MFSHSLKLCEKPPPRWSKKQFRPAGQVFRTSKKVLRIRNLIGAGEPFLPVDGVFRYRRGDLAARRISGERFLMPDTTPMAMYSVRMEEPP